MALRDLHNLLLLIKFIFLIISYKFDYEAIFILAKALNWFFYYQRYYSFILQYSISNMITIRVQCDHAICFSFVHTVRFLCPMLDIEEYVYYQLYLKKLGIKRLSIHPFLLTASVCRISLFDF